MSGGTGSVAGDFFVSTYGIISAFYSIQISHLAVHEKAIKKGYKPPYLRRRMVDICECIWEKTHIQNMILSNGVINQMKISVSIFYLFLFFYHIITEIKSEEVRKRPTGLDQYDQTSNFYIYIYI